MSALSALLSAYGESDGEPEDAPTQNGDAGRAEAKVEVPELSSLDLLFQRVDGELAFEGLLQPPVYDSECDFAEKVRENWQRSREVGMGVVEYVRTKGNFNNPELIRLLRSQLPFTLAEFGTSTRTEGVAERCKGSELLKEQDRIRKERDQEKLRKEKEKAELRSPSDLLPALQRAASTASRWAAAVQGTVAVEVSDGPGPLLAVPDPLAPTTNPTHSPHSSASNRGPGARTHSNRSPKPAQLSDPEPSALPLVPPAPAGKAATPTPTADNANPPLNVPPPPSPPPTSPVSSSPAPAAGGTLLQGLLSEKQQQALTDPAVLATLSPADQQQILSAIRVASQKLVSEVRCSCAALPGKPPLSPKDTDNLMLVSRGTPVADGGSNPTTAVAVRRTSESEDAPPSKRVFSRT